MIRTYQMILVASTLSLSWLGMQVVHEAGHVLLAWTSGETVHRVVLHPLTISRTDASHDRHPPLVAWGGPLAALGLALREGDTGAREDLNRLRREARWDREARRFVCDRSNNANRSGLWGCGTPYSESRRLMHT